MKKIIQWIYIQLYLIFAVIFLSKRKLMKIALAGGNHPLIIYNTAKYMRIWWFSILGIIIWFFGFWAFYQIISGTNEGWYYEYNRINHTVEVFGIIFDSNMFVLIVLFSGKLFQLLEILTANKMEHFKKHINYRNPNINYGNQLN